MYALFEAQRLQLRAAAGAVEIDLVLVLALVGAWFRGTSRLTSSIACFAPYQSDNPSICTAASSIVSSRALPPIDCIRGRRSGLVEVVEEALAEAGSITVSSTNAGPPIQAQQVDTP